tara:strand:- start:773 stop:1351 length:579 start_codon:yes stop_codon:yes gene_type:complete
MKFKILIVFIFFLSLINNAYSENDPGYVELPRLDDIFYIGKMESHNNNFVLFFKTRERSILARGEEFNYITDYPQDLYIYDRRTKKTEPLISYEWFPKKAKSFSNYNFPVFPEDFAYYLLNDNNTLILVSAIKDYNQNLKYDIINKELKIDENRGKLNFIISTYAKSCGYKSIKNNYECKIYKPLVSKNLLN